MHLKKLASSAVSGDSLNSTSSSTTNVDDHKLSITAKKQMKKEEKYIYLIKYDGQSVPIATALTFVV